MRIIDKNHDFYDYLQNPTDTLVFDRRGSFVLDKKAVCDEMRFFNTRFDDDEHRFIELQCGATFWVFLATLKFDSVYAYQPSDYVLELLASWKDYDKPNKLLDVNLMSLPFTKFDWKTKTRALDRKKITPESVISHVEQCFRSSNVRSLTRKENSVPILKAFGISGIIDPVDLFCAVEEYFSIEKAKSERTEAIGTTNNDKILMHGFDTRTSFRGR